MLATNENTATTKTGIVDQISTIWEGGHQSKHYSTVFELSGKNMNIIEVFISFLQMKSFSTKTSVGMKVSALKTQV